MENRPKLTPKSTFDVDDVTDNVTAWRQNRMDTGDGHIFSLLVKSQYKQSYWFSNKSNINIIYNISVITITIKMSIILANFGKYTISDCPFFCLSVCLLSIITEKRLKGFSWNFRVGGTWYNWEHFQDVPFNPLNTGSFFHFFGGIHAS